MRPRNVAVVVLSIGVLAGCGGDDSSAATPDATSGDAVEVVAKDIKFTADTYAAPAGTVELVYRNDGSISHTLVIDDVDGFKLEVAGHGDEDRGVVELDAGTYTIYCDVPGHRGAGMEATLEIR